MRTEYENLLKVLLEDFSPETRQQRLDELEQEFKRWRESIQQYGDDMPDDKAAEGEQILARIRELRSPARFAMIPLLDAWRGTFKVLPDGREPQTNAEKELWLLRGFIEDAVIMLQRDEISNIRDHVLINLISTLLMVGERMPIYRSLTGDTSGFQFPEVDKISSYRDATEILHGLRSKELRGNRGGRDASEEFKIIVRRKAQALKKAHPTWTRNRAASELLKDENIAKYPEMIRKSYTVQAITDWIKDIFPARPRA